MSNMTYAQLHMCEAINWFVAT